jgi:dephospho-CoA kinase
MRTIGLTGNIGAGKSTVGRLLAEAGVPVIDADQVARDIVEPGTPALLEIAARFPGVVGQDGRLDRKALGARIFKDPVEREALNQITHPRIFQEVVRRLHRLEDRGEPFAVYEAALLLENGLGPYEGGLIVVTVSEEEQLRRVRQRDGASEADVRARMAVQMPQAEKARRATWVLDNSGTEAELREKVLHLLSSLRAQAAHASAPGVIEDPAGCAPHSARPGGERARG